MEFHDVKVEDAAWAVPLLEANGYRSCEFSFVNIYIWKRVVNTEIARFHDFLIARYDYHGEHVHYQYPCGPGEVKTALDAILEDARALGRTPMITTVPAEQVPVMEQLYPGFFAFENPRGSADYVYNTEDLASLPGRKYQKKRNHCSRFERGYPDWEFREISPDSIDAVCAFNNRWANLYDNRDDAGIQHEHTAIEQALRHYGQLGLKGGYLTVAGELVAFSFGSYLGKDMFVTHVEKALYDVTGAYAVINREMARRFGAGCAYINRENDVGEEGLREAKLSYHPAFLVDKYHALPKVWTP